jgi:hypothetical protein
MTYTKEVLIRFHENTTDQSNMIINRSYRDTLYKPLNNMNVIINILIIVHYVLFAYIFKYNKKKSTGS